MWTGHMMEWGGYGGYGGFGLGHLLWWALLIAALIVLARWLFRGKRPAASAAEHPALSILKERYARGEIDKAEFDSRKQDIA